VRTGKKVFIVIDSVLALIGRAQLDREWAKGIQPGTLANHMNEFLKRVNPSVSKSQSVLAFTNQDRMAIASFGGYKTQTGGKALRYYSTHRMSIKKDEEIVEDGVPVGYYMILTFKKTNTDAAPAQRKMCFRYYHGFWKTEELFNIGIQEGIVIARGAWFSYGDLRVQGKPAFREALEKTPALAEKLEGEIRKKWEME
jgi:recombination protein RecA